MHGHYYLQLYVVNAGIVKNGYQFILHAFSYALIAEKIGWLDMRGVIRDVYIGWVVGNGLVGKFYSSKKW